MNSRGLHRFAVLTAAATFLLLGAGGLVTSHGVGMAVPDWPNTYGYNLFFFPVSQWVGGIFYEHTHRLLAAGVGLLTTILALWLQGNKARRFLRWMGVVLVVLAGVSKVAAPSRGADALVLGLAGAAGAGASLVWPRCQPAAPWLRILGVVAFFAVVLQGVLGGLRVVLFKDQIGIFHATLAQLFFVLTCALALFTSRWWQQLGAVSPTGQGQPGREEREQVKAAHTLRWFSVAATVLILFQLILGATMRHQHAGLAIPDFPLAYGKFWPAIDGPSIARYNQQRLEVVALNPITAVQVELQMVHRLAALAIVAAVWFCAWRLGRGLGWGHPAARLALGWGGLILLQACLGAATIWSNKAADIATAHVLVGALSLASGAMITLLLFATRAREMLPLASAPDLARSGFAPQPAPAAGFR